MIDRLLSLVPFRGSDRNRRRSQHRNTLCMTDPLEVRVLLSGTNVAPEIEDPFSAEGYLTFDLVDPDPGQSYTLYVDSNGDGEFELQTTLTTGVNWVDAAAAVPGNTTAQVNIRVVETYLDDNNNPAQNTLSTTVSITGVTVSPAPIDSLTVGYLCAYGTIDISQCNFSEEALVEILVRIAGETEWTSATAMTTDDFVIYFPDGGEDEDYELATRVTDYGTSVVSAITTITEMPDPPEEE